MSAQTLKQKQGAQTLRHILVHYLLKIIKKLREMVLTYVDGREIDNLLVLRRGGTTNATDHVENVLKVGVILLESGSKREKKISVI